MKKITFLFLVAIFAFSGYVAAQSYTTPDPAAEQSPAMKVQQFSGVVEKVNMDKKTITIKDAATSEKKDFTFSDSTLFSKGTESATASALKKGDKVVLEVDSKNTLAAVRITPETPPQK
jgi:Cu/Ag efflux protein CusF